MRRWLVPAIALIAAIFDSAAVSATYEVRVTAGGSPAPVAVVTGLLPQELVGKPLALTDNSGRAVAVQGDSKDGSPAFTFLVEELPAGQTRTLTLSSGAADAEGGVEVKETDAGAEVRIDGEPFTTYQVKNGPKPYLWPVFGPTGKPMTRAFPMQRVKGEAWDHPHHRGLWFTFDRVNDTNFWLEAPKAGKTIHREFASLTSGPVFGEIVSKVDWTAGDGKKIAEDVRTYRLYRTPGARLIDFSISMRSAEGPLRFGDSKEGLFAIRVAESMKVEAKGGAPGRIVNAAGDLDGQAWGKRAEWCDYSGYVDGEHLGAAIFDAPTNFRHPTYWHVRTYGLFAANPFGIRHFTGDADRDGAHEVPEDQTFDLSYRVYLHSGDAESAKVAEWYAAYADPPQVVVQAK